MDVDDVDAPPPPYVGVCLDYEDNHWILSDDPSTAAAIQTLFNKRESVTLAEVKANMQEMTYGNWTRDVSSIPPPVRLFAIAPPTLFQDDNKVYWAQDIKAKDVPPPGTYVAILIREIGTNFREEECLILHKPDADQEAINNAPFEANSNPEAGVYWFTSDDGFIFPNEIIIERWRHGTMEHILSGDKPNTIVTLDAF